MTKKPLIGIIMGSDSDLPLIQDAAKVLQDLRVPFRMHVASAHRSPLALRKLLSVLDKAGVRVLIAAAGGAAHLAGVIAAETILPVIGVPIRTKALSGLDSLCSMAQMPAGVPVGVMAIDGARNAGIFAAQILAVGNTELTARLRRYKKQLALNVLAKDRELQGLGHGRYIEKHFQGR